MTAGRLGSGRGEWRRAAASIFGKKILQNSRASHYSSVKPVPLPLATPSHCHSSRLGRRWFSGGQQVGEGDTLPRRVTHCRPQRHCGPQWPCRPAPRWAARPWRWCSESIGRPNGGASFSADSEWSPTTDLTKSGMGRKVMTIPGFRYWAYNFIASQNDAKNVVILTGYDGSPFCAWWSFLWRMSNLRRCFSEWYSRWYNL